MRGLRRKASPQAISTTEMKLAGNVGKPSSSTSSTSTSASSTSSSSSSSSSSSLMNETIAGGIARAGSQSTIHPLDTVKVRMQAGSASTVEVLALHSRQGESQGGLSVRRQCQLQARRVGSLYRGVFGAASGAGVAIGAYFALYSWTKKVVQKLDPKRGSGSVAFISGAIAGAGSCVVKVPIAVCIRSVQAGLFPNFYVAARSIARKTGPRGLFTGFLPTVMEDVPDMAVKFAVYESLRSFHQKVFRRKATTQEDLVFGYVAGTTSAAVTTPWDVVKTRMMCSASARPTIRGAVRSIAAQGSTKAFFVGVGPRSISSGIHSALFFCFYEAIRNSLERQAMQRELSKAAAAADASSKESAQKNKNGGPKSPRVASISAALLSLTLINSSIQ